MVVCRQVLQRMFTVLAVCCIAASPVFAQGISGTINGNRERRLRWRHPRCDRHTDQ